MKSRSFNPTGPIQKSIKQSKVLSVACLLMLGACESADRSGSSPHQSVPDQVTSQNNEMPTAQDAAAFVVQAELELEKRGMDAGRMQWVLQNFITEDTEILAARADELRTASEVRIAAEAAQYIDVEKLDFDTARKLNIMRSSIVMPAPSDAKKTSEQAELGTRLNSMYGKGRYCTEDGECRDLAALENVIAYSRDANELLEAWDGWRTISPPMKSLYQRQVELANEGARELGFDDVGTMWRSSYDMPPEDFPHEVNRLWDQVKPLYDALHCHVRAELGEHYGKDLVPENGLIPAHLLGDMWAQSWWNIYDLVAPEEMGVDFNLTSLLLANGYNEEKMVKTGEAFFSSLGFEPLPDTFWERSLFTDPEDRDVVCHASAWSVDEKDDIRIKMCVNIDDEDFQTIHHELGHNYYQRAYKDESYLYRTSANDGFHEAVGDAVALSITPEYLASIGLLENVPEASGDIGLLLKQALEKVAFLPFGLLVDQWRWKVFSGEVGPENYNSLWWELREKYQGVSAPNDRPPDAFDPGAKYHVPANTSYSRYFVAQILQFQFHRTLCDIAGNENPIHRCSIYGSQAAGEKLNAMLEMGRRQPWPDALEALSGSREMDATAILDYFAPLKDWLDDKNSMRTCGW